jgi:hypothetical protein
MALIHARAAQHDMCSLTHICMHLYFHDLYISALPPQKESLIINRVYIHKKVFHNIHFALESVLFLLPSQASS